MIVKVCGMRKAANIREISQFDVDWLGLIFIPDSPRFVTQVSARGGFYPDYSSLIKKVSELGGIPEVTKRVNKPQRVGVFADDKKSGRIISAQDYAGMTLEQALAKLK